MAKSSANLHLLKRRHPQVHRKPSNATSKIIRSSITHDPALLCSCTSIALLRILNYLNQYGSSTAIVSSEHPPCPAVFAFDVAVEDEHNLLHQLRYPQEWHDFLCCILEHKSQIEATVAFHLGLTGTGRCRLSPTEEWAQGSFNLTPSSMNPTAEADGCSNWYAISPPSYYRLRASHGPFFFTLQIFNRAISLLVTTGVSST